MTTHYETYSTEDFLQDRYFISWVKYRSVETESFWKHWIANQPKNLVEFLAAEEQLEIIFSASRIKPGSFDQEDVWEKIKATIEKDQGKVVPIFKKRKTWYYAAAISIAVALTGFLLFRTAGTEKELLVTGNGQLKKISLTDSTVIQLNANSTLEYMSKWADGSPREVYLKGEAFFDVAHLNNVENGSGSEQIFIVHTDQLKVEVLGTAFNVKERRGVTQISLERGRVKVQVKSDSLQQLILAPGELAEYAHDKNELKKVVKDPVYFKDWTENKMLTNNTSVAEILTELEDVYGYQVILRDSGIATRRIDGTIPMKNEDNVLFVLSNILGVDIEKNGRQLVIKNRK